MKTKTLVNKFPDDNRSTNVYHYCSVDTLFKILRSKKLWLFNAKFMNDELEVKWIDTVVNQSKCSLNSPHFDDVISVYNNLQEKEHYFTSFSQEKDRLSQWRGYADDGKGVAIGFSISKMYDFLGLISKSQGTHTQIGKTKTTTSKVGFEYLIYEESQQLILIRQVFDGVKTGVDIKPSAMMLKEMATTFKHPSFEEEQEVRITYTPDNNKNEEADYILKKISEKKYRTQDDKILDYYELDFHCEHISLIIPEVVIGPKCKLSKSVFTEFLQSNGFTATKISYSSSSYR